MVSLKSDELAVVLDTNFLISSLRFGISFDLLHDIVHVNHRIVVPDNVIRELSSLKLRGEDDRMRKVALKLAERFDRIELSGHVDDSLVEYASSHNAIVATNDRALRKRLRQAGVKVIIIRNRSSFACESGSQDI